MSAMEKFVAFTAVAAPYEPENVDTDQILPARFLKMPRGGGRHYGDFLFNDLRRGDDGAERPEFVLNRPDFRAARILVGNANFGCGSSREGAVYAFLDAGFRSVVAPSTLPMRAPSQSASASSSGRCRPRRWRVSLRQTTVA